MTDKQLYARLQSMLAAVPSGASQAQAKLIMTRGLDSLMKQRHIADYCVMTSQACIDVAVQPANSNGFRFYQLVPKTALTQKVWVQPTSIR